MGALLTSSKVSEQLKLNLHWYQVEHIFRFNVSNFPQHTVLYWLHSQIYRKNPVLLARAGEVHRVDRSPRLLPAYEVLGGCSLTWVETFAPRRQGCGRDVRGGCFILWRHGAAALSHWTPRVTKADRTGNRTQKREIFSIKK